MSKQIAFNNKFDRIVVLIDMDCFYCQVEEKINPTLKGKPMAVVQYNAWKGGGIIAVNYPARDRGVSRHMRGDEAKKHCPEIELVKVPNIRQKADLTKYREAGKEVAVVLKAYTSLLERASVDEAYLDITDKVLERLQEMNNASFVLKPEKLVNCYALGYENIGDYVQSVSNKLQSEEEEPSDELNENKITDQKNDIQLLIGASIVNEIRADVKAKTGYECSAGIAHNKILAKLVCGINKPNKQTIIPLHHINQLYSTLPIKKIKGLGGKFGDDVCDTLQIKLMGELARFTKEELQKRLDEKNGLWLHLIAHGIDLEAVTPRFASKSIACCKKFPGRTSIKGIATLNHWLTELSNEIFDRLEKDEIENNRKASQMVVSYIQEINHTDISSSRSVNLNLTDVEKMASDALDVIKKNTQIFFQTEKQTVLNNPLKFLGISVGKFEDIDTNKKNTIQDMFKNQTKKNELNSINIESDNRNYLCVENTEVVVNRKNVIQDMFTNHKIKTELNSTILNSTHKNKLQEITEPSKCSKNPIQNMFTNHRKSKELNSSACANNNSSSEDLQPNVNSSILGISREILPLQLNITKSNLTDSKLSFFENIIETKTDIDNNNICIEDNLYKNDNNNAADTARSIDEDSSTHKIISETNLNLEIDYEMGESSKNYNGNIDKIDYTLSYAEFHRPHIQDIVYEKCSKCNKKVAQLEMQSHTDSHLAFQLSQQQREEFRNQLKSNITPPAAKKVKIEQIKNNKLNRTNSKLLDSFFVKQNNSQIDDGMGKENCTECGKQISIDDMNEHRDYHAAKRLQLELNQTTNTHLMAKKTNSKTKSKTANSFKSVAYFFK